MTDGLLLDGSHGEGGGQILRTALALSALTGTPFRLERIRAGRHEPGLRPQHLAAVRGVARLCAAELEGAAVGSSALSFTPTAPVTPGDYQLDVSELAGTGSAGSVTLLFQALFLPLALAGGRSSLELRGGTHVPFSPPYPYLSQVYLPAVRRLGLAAETSAPSWGWYPRGGGVMLATVSGGGGAPTPLELTERGRLVEVWVYSAASNLPEHVVERQAGQALARLRARHIKAEVQTELGPSPGPGSLLLVLAEYEHVIAGFSAYGRLRYPAERVADDALDAFEAYHGRAGAADPHLADQLLLPLVLAPGASHYTCSEVTQHLLTNAWVIERFLPPRITVEGALGEPGRVLLAPR